MLALPTTAMRGRFAMVFPVLPASWMRERWSLCSLARLCQWQRSRPECVRIVGSRKEEYRYSFSEGEPMFTPPSLTIALLMMIISAACWGSWANTFKGVKNYRFELFYWDYAIGIFLISLVLALTMGSTGNDASSFLNNVHSADTSNILSTLVGGAIFNLANLLLVAAIDMAGLAIAFPVSIGIALVVGVISSYALQPRGNAPLLAAGVVCAVIAVIMDGKAYGSLASVGRPVS